MQSINSPRDLLKNSKFSLAHDLLHFDHFMAGSKVDMVRKLFAEEG